MSDALTRGVLFVHSAPSALCPHIEWAIGSVVDQRTDLHWTEQSAAPGVDSSRWSHTPELGIFHATTDAAGNIMVSEERIRWAYEKGAGDPAIVYQELSIALGEAWDEELEPFRYAAEGAPVRWLHQVI